MRLCRLQISYAEACLGLCIFAKQNATLGEATFLMLGCDFLKLSKETMKLLLEINNAIYDDIKIEFLYHSNKLEGSTFNLEQLNVLLDEDKIVGEHSVDDVQETINSLKLFDFVIKTIDEQLTPRLLKEYHSLLKTSTIDSERRFAGIYKKIPNKLRGIDIETAQPYEVEEKIDKLLEMEINTIEDIANFHQEFEHIHPFQDGNGRIGRYLILRQCIEKNIDLIAIDDEYNKEYKQALYIAQKDNNISLLVEILKKSQMRLDKKLSKYQKGIEELNESYKI